MRHAWGGLAALAALLVGILPRAVATPAVPSPSPVPASSAPVAPPIPEVSITAPEPRYVAPTLRDRIGRIWAPVYLNGQGPFRLVLDTGASNSAVIAQVAAELGLPLDGAMMLHGVTGSATVGFVTVNTFVVGDMESHDRRLPLVPDALGGAEGVLGIESLNDKRIYIDFMHDKITIMHSHGQHAEEGYSIIPLTRTANGLLMARAYVRGIRVNAIIDTGAQATVANPALLAALRAKRSYADMKPSLITGATDAVQTGQDTAMPPVSLGTVTINSAFITFCDLDIFERWHMTAEPAMLIGIDTLGLLDRMVIDYRRMELQVRTRHNYE
jgi:predicted aspartyl protease